MPCTHGPRVACRFLPALLFAFSAASQTSPTVARSATVTAATGPITIDGVLDESAWQLAPKIGDLIQREPRNGEAPSERTEVTLLHDHDYLYIGVVCHDSQPGAVIGTQMARDAALASDDRISIVLDTYRDQRSAYFFATNPLGALIDGLVFANGQSNNDWDAIWNVQARRTAQGWTVEFAIPFKSLSFPSGGSTWGFNFSRNIQRKFEEDRWSGARLQTQFLQVSEAGEISLPESITQGIGLDVRPFTSGRWLHTGSTGDDVLKGKPGLDLFYNITPNLKVSATVNTDFGETEVDARQINLTRYSLFLPEKRSFFLQDAGVFNFATSGVTTPGGIPATGADLFPFFSRQIGLLNGEEVPIDYGVKLTGKIGKTDLGVLAVRTRDLNNVPAKNLYVARARQNFWRQSYVGGIFTSGNPSQSISSRTYGADLRLATSDLLGTKKNLVVNAYALRSANEGTTSRDASWGFSAQFPNDRYDAQIILREVPQDFRPALGFVQRRNIRMLRLAGSFNPRPKKFLGVQQMFHDVFYTRFTRLDNGQVESWDLYATVLDWHFRSGDSLHALLDINPTYERLFAPFQISPGVFLPPGEYRFTRYRGVFSSAQRRRLTGSINYSFGDYWSGTANMFTLGAGYKIPPYFVISVTSNQTFARLPQGNFVARIHSAQVSFAASPFLSISNLIQYDNQSRNLGWQARVRWILRPGNDLFLIFNQGWVQDPMRKYEFFAQDTRLSGKLQYTFRF